MAGCVLGGAQLAGEAGNRRMGDAPPNFAISDAFSGEGPWRMGADRATAGPTGDLAVELWPGRSGHVGDSGINPGISSGWRPKRAIAVRWWQQQWKGL